MFQALPKPQRSANNGIITRQSGKLILTFKDANGDPFDASSLAGTDAKVVPFESDVTPVTLGVGVISGASNEIYTVEWVRDTIPSSWSTFAQDADGAIVLYVELEESGVADYFQTYTRFNVTDGDFKGDATNLPLVVFNYTWDDAIASEWAQFNRGTPLNLTDSNAYLAGKRNTDWGAVVDKDLTTSPVGVDNAQYIIAGIGGDWSGFTINDIVRYSLTDLVWYARPPAEGDEVYVADETTRYRYDGAAWQIAAAGDVVGPGVSVDDNIATFDLTTGKIIQDSGVNISAVTASKTITDFITVTQAVDLDTIETDVSANNSKVTNATHTGDVTGATALTLATVNGDVGSFTNADLTVNAKGLITAVSNGSGGGAGSDTTAIHDNVSGEILAVTEKVSPTSGDYILIEDGADSNNKKRVNVTNLPTGGGGEANTASNVGGFEDVFKTKSGIDLQFKTLQSSDGSLAFTGNTDDVDIVVDQQVMAAGTDNDQTGTTYTLVIADAENTTVWMDNAASNTLTIPLNAAVAFPIGTKINVVMEGAGVTTIDITATGTINGVVDASVVINNQFQAATLTKRAVNSWVIIGDIT